jgi:hypothetical protein
MFRNAPWTFVVDALVSLTMLLAPAAMSESYQGQVMTVSQGKLMLATDRAQTIVDVPESAAVMLDGKAAALADLQTGFNVVVTANEQEGRIVATTVIATSAGVAGNDEPSESP